MDNLIEISQHFKLKGTVVSASLHESGHIHDTYLLKTADQAYILQQVNEYVFPQPETLVANIHFVSTHLRKKAAQSGADPDRATLTMIPTHKGGWLHCHIDGTLWRIFEFIPGTTTFETARHPAQVYQAGLAVGEFIAMLSDFPAEQLAETIPNFHHTPARFADFLHALKQDPHNRAGEIKPEIEFILSRQGQLSRLVDLLESGELPLRVTHNDTKISNVLFDIHTGEAVCLIDLDTVMPGSLLYDFGDACRTLTNTAAEDEPDLTRVAFNENYYDQFTRGFLKTAGDTLTPLERELLPFSAILMTLECGMRFLEDHLNGDIYFHTSRPDHNLQRARVQFRLAELMERHFDEIIQTENEAR